MFNNTPTNRCAGLTILVPGERNLRLLGKVPPPHENSLREKGELPLLPPTFAKRLSQGNYDIESNRLFNAFKDAMVGPWEGSSWIAKPMLLMGEPPINKDHMTKLIFGGIDTIINLLSNEESEVLFGTKNLNPRAKTHLSPEMAEDAECVFDIQVEMNQIQEKVKYTTKHHLKTAETSYNSTKRHVDQFIAQVTENGKKKIQML